MAESALLKLVGNDPRKADELITVIAGLVLSFLKVRCQKGEGCAKHGQQNQGGAHKPLSGGIHKAVNTGAGTSQP